MPPDAPIAPDGPTPPDDAPPPPGSGAEDGTLGGYFAVHTRPPAFEGPDGQPYTVSLETERTGDLRAPFQAYLVFPRWAATGVGIVGHVETDTLFECRTREDALDHLGALALADVKRHLDIAVGRAGGEVAEDRSASGSAPGSDEPPTDGSDESTTHGSDEPTTDGSDQASIHEPEGSDPLSDAP